MSTAPPRHVGTLKTWNAERGFGFIEPDHGGDDIFVHVSELQAAKLRPEPGTRLTFTVSPGPQGKKRAANVRHPLAASTVTGHARPRGGAARAARSVAPDAPANWTLGRVLVLPCFLVLYGLTVRHVGVKPFWHFWYVGVSVVTFFAYVFDKSAAKAGRWRTAESTLHGLSLGGGWPGALLAQQLMRHKTTKAAFVAMFWLTVVLNMALFAGWHWQVHADRLWRLLP